MRRWNCIWTASPRRFARYMTMPTLSVRSRGLPWHPPRCRCKPSFICARAPATRFCSPRRAASSGFAARQRSSGRLPAGGTRVPRPASSGGAADSGGPPLSQVLLRMAADETRQRISVGDLLEALRDRAIGALIFVFALPNIIPMPPGASSILGAPLLFLTAQLTFARRPWLPKVIAAGSVDRAHFAATVQRLAPWLGRVERLLRPRMTALARPPFEYLIGGICLFLSIILFLPIPMGNMP